ncbi:MAG: DUF6328 family protein [Gaiellaceae bacterium]
MSEYVYYATLLSTAVALVLLMAPAVHHRVRFREGDKAGAFVAFTAWRWWALALFRSHAENGDSAAPRAEPGCRARKRRS